MRRVALLASFASTLLYPQFIQEGPKLVGTGAFGAAEQGNAVAISADGNTVIEGGCVDNGHKGAVWFFTRSNGLWSQQGGKLVGTGAVGTDVLQGISVAISADGNTAIEGGFGDNGGLGAVWVFTRTNGVWSQQESKLIATGASGNAGFGVSVALSADGNTALIGGSYDNNSAGAVWVFTRSNGAWSQQGTKLVGTGPAGSSWQGRAIGISADGNTAIEGGPFDNNYGGAAWVFTRTNGVWSQQGNKLVGSGAVGSIGEQGLSVALSGDGNTVILGAPGDGFLSPTDNPIGAAWIFARTNGTWSQQGNKVVGSGGIGQGSSVGLSGDGNTAIVGSTSDNGFVGAAWIFTRTGTVWNQLGNKLVGSDSSGLPTQGQSVALSADGNTAIVGGPFDNAPPPGFPGLPAPGASWIYVRTPKIYVINSGDFRVDEFDGSGGHILSWGSEGTGNGQFLAPSGIVVDSTGNVWVTDSGLNRVQEFDSDGNFLMSFGSIGRGPGQLYQPFGIAVDSAGNLWIADTGNNRIQKFTNAGVSLAQFGKLGGGNGQFNAPFGITIDTSGNVWVADTGNNRIQKLDGSGNFLLKFGSFGNGQGLFEAPHGIATDAANNIFVADTMDQRIEEFNNLGVFVRKFGGGFSYPSPFGIAIDHAGAIWAVDYNSNWVSEFDGSGTKLVQFGVTGGGPGQLFHPTYVAVH